MKYGRVKIRRSIQKIAKKIDGRFSTKVFLSKFNDHYKQGLTYYEAGQLMRTTPGLVKLKQGNTGDETIWVYEEE